MYNIANLLAVQRIERWLDSSIDVYQTIGVETVLSSDKCRRLVIRAKAAGFRGRMIYVLLASAELQMRRVAIRVQGGGHDVPQDKLVARRARSFEQFAWFVREVDDAYVFDNSTGEPELIGATASGALVQMGDFPEDFMAALSAGDSAPVDIRRR